MPPGERIKRTQHGLIWKWKTKIPVNTGIDIDNFYSKD